jgi:hypothetical protein
MELLDWETKPEDFDRLCQHVIGLLCSRGHWAREKLFALIPEEQLRREIRATAETFEERFVSLPMFIYMWLNKKRENHDTQPGTAVKNEERQFI